METEQYMFRAIADRSLHDLAVKITEKWNPAFTWALGNYADRAKFSSGRFLVDLHAKSSQFPLPTDNSIVTSVFPGLHLGMDIDTESCNCAETLACAPPAPPSHTVESFIVSAMLDHNLFGFAQCMAIPALRERIRPSYLPLLVDVAILVPVPKLLTYLPSIQRLFLELFTDKKPQVVELPVVVNIVRAKVVLDLFCETDPERYQSNLERFLAKDFAPFYKRRARMILRSVHFYVQSAAKHNRTEILPILENVSHCIVTVVSYDRTDFDVLSVHLLQ